MKKKTEKPIEDKLNKAFEHIASGENTRAESEEKEELGPMDKIAQLERENAELKDKYLRSMAEFENYRRRSIQEKSDWIKLATQNLAAEVCDVVDNFERALALVNDADRENGFVKGVIQIEQQTQGCARKRGSLQD